MSSGTESCGCGAKIVISNATTDAILGKRLAEWRTTHRHESVAPIATEASTPEHQPQGNNFATTERNYDSAPHEMNAEGRRWWPAEGPYGRAISLKWHPHD